MTSIKSIKQKSFSAIIISSILIFGMVSCSSPHENDYIQIATGNENSEVIFEKAYSLGYRKYTGVNPLKGFMDFDGGHKDAFPHSLEYIPVNLEEVMKAEGSVDFSVVEIKLNSCAASGHQAVIRFILDTPGETCHIPAYIRNKIDTFNYSFEGSSGVTPDYNDEYFISEICKFIKSFSAYDGDPRLASIQTGIIGHWGEQHIYLVENSTGYTAKWNVADSTWKKFFDEWGTDFTKTKLSTRNPSRPGHNKYSSIGYYNDMIGSKEDDEYFDELMQSKNSNPDSWKTSHVSGEIAPALQDALVNSIVNKTYDTDVYKKYDEDLSLYHVSCALFSKLFGKDKNVLKNNQSAFLSAQSLMGYDFYVDEAKSSYDGNALSVDLHVVNKGVAPFPYRWEVELALHDGNEVFHSSSPNWNFTDIVNKNESKSFSHKYSVKLNEGKEYLLLLKIKNPMTGGYPVRFSNETQDADVSDYLTIGKIKS